MEITIPTIEAIQKALSDKRLAEVTRTILIQGTSLRDEDFYYAFADVFERILREQND